MPRGGDSRKVSAVNSTTQRLYERDPYLIEISDAEVVSREEAGKTPTVILDRTVFYATSGGQPHDTGTIEGVPVIGVEHAEKFIVHTLARPLPETVTAGSRVGLRVDRARRLDYMSQHHGQHLLSAALAETCRAETVSVHFGETESTLDLSRLISDGQIAEAVARTNEIIMDDRQVRIHEVARADIGKFKLRKEPGVDSEILRIVEVVGFDTTPCSGTHPPSTGRVGPVLVIGTEKMRGGTRLIFLCGVRALRDATEKNRMISCIAKDLSVAPEGLAEMITKTRNSERELKRRVRALEEVLAERTAADLDATRPAGPIVVKLDPGHGEDEPGALTAALVARGRAAIVAGDSGGMFHVLVAAPKGSPFDSKRALGAAMDSLGGRGGGNAAFARGAAPRGGDLDAALGAAAQAIVRENL